MVVVVAAVAAASVVVVVVIVVVVTAVVVLDVVAFTVDVVLVCNLWLKCTNDKLCNRILVITLPHNEALYCLGYAMQ